MGRGKPWVRLRLHRWGGSGNVEALWLHAALLFWYAFRPQCGDLRGSCLRYPGRFRSDQRVRGAADGAGRDGARSPSRGNRRVPAGPGRSEEHTSELQSLMRSSYAVYCLKKTKSNSISNDINPEPTTIRLSHQTHTHK